MNQRLKRIRGALGTGLTWAVAWAVGGILIGVSSIVFPGRLWDIFFSIFDAPLPALAIPGFFGGVLFSIVLGIAARHRRFEELSLPRFAALGAVGGILLCILPALMLGGVGGSGTNLWYASMVIGGPFTLLGAASASGSLLLARAAEGSILLQE
jgi:hypothetical protein